MPRPIYDDARDPEPKPEPDPEAKEDPAGERGALSRRDGVNMLAARVKGEFPGARVVADRVRMGRLGDGVSGGVMAPTAGLLLGLPRSERETVAWRARRVAGREEGVGGAMDALGGVEVEAEEEGFSDSAVWRVRLPVGAIVGDYCRLSYKRR